ncbi:hypothetical protein ANN_17114 [Periplaneta americana]|uniref:Uncharacterized protein n=1 Tax=Periplaneta americana TaxID=6978 RepID=A0ABQ8STF4_PERAM|nr:hypothetical protein ANN_17114 [Periplaneta americana]
MEHKRKIIVQEGVGERTIHHHKNELKETDEWLTKWRIQASENNSVHVTFGTRIENCPPVTLYNEEPPEADDVKYLENDSLSTKEAQCVFQEKGVKEDLAYIDAHFTFVADTIQQLESRKSISGDDDDDDDDYDEKPSA